MIKLKIITLSCPETQSLEKQQTVSILNTYNKKIHPKKKKRNERAKRIIRESRSKRTFFEQRMSLPIQREGQRPWLVRR